MPERLRGIRENGNEILSRYTDEVENLFEQFPLQASIQDLIDSPEFGVAVLDAKMLTTGIYRSGGKPKEQALKSVGVLSTIASSPPSLTYGDIVLNNPEQYTRTFTGLPSEKDFYLQHKEIETYLAMADSFLLKSIKTMLKDGLNSITFYEVRHNLHEIRDYLETFVNVMTRLGKINKEEFDTFRQYLGGIKDGRTGVDLPGLVREELSGPSGLYTTGLPVLEIHLSGFDLGPSYYSELARLSPYFDKRGRERIRDAYLGGVNGLTLRGVLKNIGLIPPPVGEIPSYMRALIDSIIHVSEQIHRFRAEHLRAVYNIILKRYGLPPDYTHTANGDLVTGTGGTPDIKEYLIARMRENLHFPEFYELRGKGFDLNEKF